MSLNDNLNEGIQDFTDRHTRIEFVITNNCNKNCTYCLRKLGIGQTVKINYMKIEDYKYVISCITKEDRKKFRRVVITGGEPLLHPNFIEFVKLARKDFPKAVIGIQTNGRLITRLPQKKLRVLPDIKNLVFSVSHYPNWNDEIRERYDNNKKLPNIYRRIIRKALRFNKYIRNSFIEWRFPIVKIRKFLEDPLKRGNVNFCEFEGFVNPLIDPNLSEEMAKRVRSTCIYHVYVINKRLYNCCISEVYERNIDADSVSAEFDKNWQRNWFKLPTWKACAHCNYGYDRYKLVNMESKLGYKKQELIDFQTRRKVRRIKDHE